MSATKKPLHFYVELAKVRPMLVKGSCCRLWVPLKVGLSLRLATGRNSSTVVICSIREGKVVLISL